MIEATLAPLKQSATISTTDMVFRVLYDAVVTLELEPGMKVSEAEVAKMLNVSRQPVRDAFFRLSKLGFLEIRPQRATLITKISEPAVMQAYFVRQALEIASLHEAIDKIDANGEALLRANINNQRAAKQAGNRKVFHELDDEFHWQISEIGGHGYVWNIIKEHKAHMDRTRYLSLSFGSQATLDEHQEIMEAIIARDHQRAEDALRQHLAKIEQLVKDIRRDNEQYFDETIYEF